jgi:ABC-type iron transport system FetAB ATPase subunit
MIASPQARQIMFHRNRLLYRPDVVLIAMDCRGPSGFGRSTLLLFLRHVAQLFPGTVNAVLE